MKDICLLFLISLTALTVLATADLDNTRNVHNCDHLIPQSDHFSYGYDVTQFDLFTCEKIRGRRIKIFDAPKCSRSGNKFRFSDDRRTEYELSDGMTASTEELIENVPGVLVNDFNDFISRLSKPTLSLGEANASDVSKGHLTSSHILSPLYFALNLKAGTNLWKSSHFKLRLPYTESRKRLSSEFITMVNELPSTYRGSESSYLDFVKRFGTHIISEATFGGMNMLLHQHNRNTTEKDFLNIFRNDSRDFMKLTATSVITACESEGIKRTLLLKNKYRGFGQVILGGDVRNYRNFSGEKWMKSVKSFPALVSARMVPISYLINDQQKSLNLWNAIRVHMLTAYINFYFDNSTVGTALKGLLDTGCFAQNETDLAKTKYASVTKENKYDASFLETVGDELRDQFWRIYQIRDVQCLRNAFNWK